MGEKAVATLMEANHERVFRNLSPAKLVEMASSSISSVASSVPQAVSKMAITIRTSTAWVSL